MRLISIYGKDDGTLTYAVGDYYDFSGGHRQFMPFRNHVDAYEFFKGQVLNCTISDEVIKTAKKYNIELPMDKLKEFQAKKTTELIGCIERYQKTINDWNKSIEDIANLG